MAISFLQERKTQKNLILVFVAILLIIILIIWQGFLKKESSGPEVFPTIYYKEIKIDFESLKSPLLEKFQQFLEISPFSGDSGRENPFISY
ncbi:MAG: hypothetical protein ABIG08_01765 [bacterium]